MTLPTILGFLVGRADAIRQVASSKAAFWTGIALVLLTAFPRNYDQTYIPEKPVLWFLGPLLFSLVSGTWLFLISYGVCARRTMADADGNKPPLWPAWRGFMGAFWMTAPIAWIYAIPVERFWDSLTATKANLWLLGIVSLWRVLLMARVFHVVCRAPAWLSLLWVLLPAAIEVLVIVFFSESFGRRLMAAMGGMRNSAEEDLIFAVLSFVFGIAFWSTPVLLLLWGIWNRYGNATPWPTRNADRIPFKSLAVFAALWIAATIPAQRELRHTSAVEQFIAKGEMRAAIDYMNSRLSSDFAKGRPLPPKTHEWKSIEELAGLLDELRPDDRPWIHKHLLARLDSHVDTQLPRRTTRLPGTALPEDAFKWGLSPWMGKTEDWRKIVHGLRQSAEGAAWIQQQTNLWQHVFVSPLPPTDLYQTNQSSEAHKPLRENP